MSAKPGKTKAPRVASDQAHGTNPSSLPAAETFDCGAEFVSGIGVEVTSQAAIKMFEKPQTAIFRSESP